MISEQMSERLTKQMQMEFQAFFKYLAISAYCESASLIGFANWFAEQSEEERGHAMKIYRYLLDQDKPVKLLPLEEPKYDFGSLEDAVAAALSNEEAVTKAINEIAAFCVQQNDYATYFFLQWFVTEQVEEESTVRTMLDRVRMVKNSGDGLLALDREFGVRVGGGADSGSRVPDRN